MKRWYAICESYHFWKKHTILHSIDINVIAFGKRESNRVRSHERLWEETNPKMILERWVDWGRHSKLGKSIKKNGLRLACNSTVSLISD